MDAQELRDRLPGLSLEYGLVFKWGNGNMIAGQAVGIMEKYLLVLPGACGSWADKLFWIKIEELTEIVDFYDGLQLDSKAEGSA